jgi:hypothetical protein
LFYIDLSVNPEVRLAMTEKSILLLGWVIDVMLALLLVTLAPVTLLLLCAALDS